MRGDQSMVLAMLPLAAKRLAARKRGGGPERSALAERCRSDVELFARYFFPAWIRDDFSNMHRDFFRRYRDASAQRGLKEATAAPRGHAKTTIKTMIKVIHDCVYGLEQFILVVSSTGSLADDKVQQIRDELEHNTLIRETYGPQPGGRWNKGDFMTASGTRVMAASPRTQVRGLIQEGIRPTKIILDDAENSEHVQTQLQREKLWTWLMSDIAKLGTRETNIEVIGTILHPDSLLAKLLQNPGYTHLRYQAVLSFAQAISLWQEWRALYIDLDNASRREDARAFFEAHREAMLDGSRVLWPEHESYYDLMETRLVEGEVAFQFEKQNNPIPHGLYIFDMDAAGYCAIAPEEVLRADGRRVPMISLRDTLVAFWDPSVGNSPESDWSACPVLGADPQGFAYVLDTYLAQGESPSTQVAGVVDMLWRWRVTKIGLEANNFQSLLISDLREAIAQRALEEEVDWPVTIVPVINLRAKPVRIATLEPPVANRWLWFSSTLPAESLRQFREFRTLPDSGYDDFPDAVEGAMRLLKGLR